MSTGSKLFVAIAGMLALGLLIGSGALIVRLATQPEGKAAATGGAGGATGGTPDPAPLPTGGAGGTGATPGPGGAGAGQASPVPTVTPGDPGNAQVSSQWLDDVAQKTRIPRRAVQSYVGAALWAREQFPRCNLQWNTLAAVGAVESDHGRMGGVTLDERGDTTADILGPVLDGQNGTKRIDDTDGGRFDGNDQFDRAIGPMQFLPQIWTRLSRDGNGDRKNDPNNMDDATVTAAAYLCQSGSLSTSVGWEKAVRSYNDSDTYIKSVFATANNITRVISPGARAPAPQTVPATPGR